MGNWFPKEGRGLVFGLWTCHQYTGDIVAAFAGAYILSSSLDWRMAIIIPLVLNGLWSLVNLTCVPNTPKEIGIETKESRAADAAAVAAGKSTDDEPSPIGIVSEDDIHQVIALCSLPAPQVHHAHFRRSQVVAVLSLGVSGRSLHAS
jgi:sugar phosphate permease